MYLSCYTRTHAVNPKQDVDWSAAFPTQPLSVPLRAFGQLLDALSAARTDLATATAAAALPDDIPDDFLDPITMELLRDPVVLPDSQIVVDRCDASGRHSMAAPGTAGFGPMRIANSHLGIF